MTNHVCKLQLHIELNSSDLNFHWKSVPIQSRPVPHGLNCRPGPCEGVAGAMSASRVVCKVVQFTVKQRQLHANICNGDAS